MVKGYKYYLSHRRKSDAKRTAFETRKDGWNVRVVPTKGGYDLWKRRR